MFSFKCIKDLNNEWMIHFLQQFYFTSHAFLPIYICELWLIVNLDCKFLIQLDIKCNFNHCVSSLTNLLTEYELLKFLFISYVTLFPSTAFHIDQDNLLVIVKIRRIFNRFRSMFFYYTWFLFIANLWLYMIFSLLLCYLLECDLIIFSIIVIWLIFINQNACTST